MSSIDDPNSEPAETQMEFNIQSDGNETATDSVETDSVDMVSGDSVSTDPISADAAILPQPKRRMPAIYIRRFGVRELILAWCGWLMGAWAVSLISGPAVPAARWMVFATVLGMMLVWPAFRLSHGWIMWRVQSDSDDNSAATDHNDKDNIQLVPGALGRTFADWLALIIVFQFVVWPLRLVSEWSTAQAFWIDLTVIGWTLITAAIVGLGSRYRHALARTLAMVGCALLLLGEPIFRLLGDWPTGEDAVMAYTPIEILWQLSAYDPGTPLAMWNPIWSPLVITVILAGAVAWIALPLSSALTETKS